MARPSALPAPGPYPFKLIAWRVMFAGPVCIGFLLILATGTHEAMTGVPHSLPILAFGVSLIIAPVVLAASATLARWTLERPE